MNPDWNKFVEEFCKPVSMLMITIVAMFFITVGINALKERAKIEKKLGTKAVKWILEMEEE